MSPISQNTCLDLPLIIWNVPSNDLPDKEGRLYIVTNGIVESDAIWMNGKFLNHKLDKVVGWREKQ